jgi:hypothetical protein
MGIWDAFSEIVEAVTPWSVVEAEAPAEEPKVRHRRRPFAHHAQSFGGIRPAIVANPSIPRRV